MTNMLLREQLILAHMPQVRLLAQRMHLRCPQVELDDLISAGTIGLIQATDRYDESRGCLLKTLAEHRIRGAMLDYLRQVDPLPRKVRQFQKHRDALIAELAVAGEAPSHEQLARTLGVTERKYLEMSRMILASEPVSLAGLLAAA